VLRQEYYNIVFFWIRRPPLQSHSLFLLVPVWCQD